MREFSLEEEAESSKFFVEEMLLEDDFRLVDIFRGFGGNAGLDGLFGRLVDLEKKII